ncbi:hypothetical protein CBOS2020_38940 (plasmid) [Clostridium botulinum]|nr:hypothetical protein CBOS2020_38940 [Clostridium botulinum]
MYTLILQAARLAPVISGLSIFSPPFSEKFKEYPCKTDKPFSKYERIIYLILSSKHKIFISIL